MDIKDFKNDIKNILIIRRNNIGDMICAIPVLRTIRMEFPQAHITVLADGTNAGIIEGASFIDSLLIFKKNHGIYKNKYIGCWRLFYQTKKEFDLAIALKIGFLSTLSLITLISGARLRMGCVSEKWHLLQLCYNLYVRGWKKWKSMHQIDALFEFIKTINESLNTAFVYCVYTDSKNNVWVGTKNSGVFKIDILGSVTNYSDKNGLSNNYVKTIIEGKKNELLIGTIDGICLIKNNTVSVLNLPKIGVM